MSELKELKVKALLDVLLHLRALKKMYKPASSAWVLINAAQGHIKAVHHLQTETCLLEDEAESLEKELEKIGDG